MSRNQRHERGRAHRRGSILIVAIVCLAVVMALVGGMLLSALRSTRQLRTERDLRQCQLLLAAGIARAESQLAATANYQGETWRLSADQINSTAAGEVTIQVATDAASKQRELQVVAEYPLGDETSVRRSQTIIVPITRPERQE
jgi:type II secretory pathway component PulK